MQRKELKSTDGQGLVGSGGSSGGFENEAAELPADKDLSLKGTAAWERSLSALPFIKRCRESSGNYVEQLCFSTKQIGWENN